MRIGGILLFCPLCPVSGEFWDWVPTKPRFESVDSCGFLRHIENWGKIDLGNGLQVPIAVSFESNRDTTSPYLGRGWQMAFLESRATPVSEHELLVIMPDSSNFLFRRKNDDKDGVFQGNQEWQGKFTADGRRFNAWGPSGCRISWDDGKISEILTSEGLNIQYLYDRNVVSGVRAGNALVFETERANSGAVEGFLVNNKRIAIEKDRKPEVQIVAGNRVIGEMSQSLSAVKFPERNTRKYEFIVDAGKLLPELQIFENGGLIKHYSWDPATRFILSSDDWKYQISPLENGWGDIAIKRIKSDGRTEFWSYDSKKGQISTEKDGNRTLMSKFLTGPAKHKVRKIEHTSVDQRGEKKETKDVKYSYDASGKLIRITGNQFELRSLDNKKIELYRDGNSKAMITQLPDDRILWEAANLKGIPLTLSRNTLGPLAEYIELFHQKDQ